MLITKEKGPTLDAGCAGGETYTVAVSLSSALR